MKLRFVIALFALACIAAAPLRAEDNHEGGIKSTTTLHPDGTRTDLIKDLSAGTGESKTFDAAGKVLQSMKFKLNDQGEPVEGTTFNSKGVAVFKFTYNRDASGRLNEELDMDASGKLLRRLVYRYNSTGGVAGIDAFDAQGNQLQATSGNAKKDVHRRK